MRRASEIIRCLIRVARGNQALITLLAGFVYGAADQYLGSRIGLGEWTVAVSQMSAPWLAIAFVAGAWPQRRVYAMTMGAAITSIAVAGYLLMTLSPLEGVSPGSIHWGMELRSQLHIILPALVTGPLFGWLGGCWRRDHDLAPALLVAALFALEPLARIAARQLIDSHSLVWPMEVAAGAALAVAAVWFKGATSRRSDS